MQVFLESIAKHSSLKSLTLDNFGQIDGLGKALLLNKSINVFHIAFRNLDIDNIDDLLKYFKESTILKKLTYTQVVLNFHIPVSILNALSNITLNELILNFKVLEIVEREDNEESFEIEQYDDFDFGKSLRDFLLKNTNLKYLKIAGIVSKKIFSLLCDGLLGNNCLTDLILYDKTFIGDGILKIIQVLKMNKSLKNIRLYFNDKPNEYISLVKDFIKKEKQNKSINIDIGFAEFYVEVTYNNCVNYPPC